MVVYLVSQMAVTWVVSSAAKMVAYWVVILVALKVVNSVPMMAVLLGLMRVGWKVDHLAVVSARNMVGSLVDWMEQWMEN